MPEAPPPLQLKDWSELDRVAALPELQEVLFLGNPIYEGMDRKTAKLNVSRGGLAATRTHARLGASYRAEIRRLP